MLGPIVRPGLRVLFVGINPSLRSAEVGHHFARPGNRFWPTLHAADELSREELRAGAADLDRLVREIAPRLVAVVGLGAYRVAFERPKARWGLQPDEVGGRPVWVLPNPSGLNAHYKPADFARLYAEARAYAEALPG